MELYLEISSFASAGDFLEGFFASRCKNVAIKSFDCRYAFDFFGAYINVNCNRQSIYRMLSSVSAVVRPVDVDSRLRVLRTIADTLPLN